MELYKEVVIKAIERHKVEITIPNLDKIIESKMYEALEKIKAIMEDDSLEDKECFMKIEEILCVYEELGSICSNRHDF